MTNGVFVSDNQLFLELRATHLDLLPIALICHQLELPVFLSCKLVNERPVHTNNS